MTVGRSSRDQRAVDAAPVSVGDDVLVHMVAGAGPWEDEFPITYEVVRITAPNRLTTDDYLLRARHENPPYMADGVRDTTLLPQERRGKSWEVIGDD